MEYELKLTEEEIQGLTNAFSALLSAGFRGAIAADDAIFMLLVNGKQYDVDCKFWTNRGGVSHGALMRVWKGTKYCYLPEIEF